MTVSVSLEELENQIGNVERQIILAHSGRADLEARIKEANQPDAELTLDVVQGRRQLVEELTKWSVDIETLEERKQALEKQRNTLATVSEVRDRFGGYMEARERYLAAVVEKCEAAKVILKRVKKLSAEVERLSDQDPVGLLMGAANALSDVPVDLGRLLRDGEVVFGDSASPRNHLFLAEEIAGFQAVERQVRDLLLELGSDASRVFGVNRLHDQVLATVRRAAMFTKKDVKPSSPPPPAREEFSKTVRIPPRLKDLDVQRWKETQRKAQAPMAAPPGGEVEAHVRKELLKKIHPPSPNI